jgi:hypothetical protein
MVVNIITAGVMPDPLAVGMDARSAWVSGFVAKVTVLCRGALLKPGFRTGAFSLGLRSSNPFSSWRSG